MNLFNITVKQGVFCFGCSLVNIGHRGFIFFKRKLNLELGGADHMYRLLSRAVFSKNRVFRFAFLGAETALFLPFPPQI